ncbi:MAG: glycosyl transferase [Bacteroidetes bacterium]|nr:MAG: glycosyl transferase [Bacteroidota bacterium]
MKIVIVGNYPPRKCGIATFTENLVNAILLGNQEGKDNIEIEVIAMNDTNQHYNYPEIVKRIINENDKKSYFKAADYINESGATLCLLQHEYGIFGGNSGILLLGLIKALKIPLVSTFHTVLEHPNFHQQEVMKSIASHSSRIVVMCSKAVPMLKNIFDVDAKKINVIEHGVPDFEELLKPEPIKPKKWANKKVIITFGLLNRNKGIETVLRALPMVVEKHPEVLYVVLGKTHPNVVKEHGEEYRKSLAKITKQLNLENHVEFLDQYVSEKDLASILSLADIYITPYLNKEQITSGTLSYAMGAGLAVVSTPYWHAEEVLSNGLGRFFDFYDYQQLASVLNSLLDDEGTIKELKERAKNHESRYSWPLVGNKYRQLIINVTKNAIQYMLEVNTAPKIPPFSFKAIGRLTTQMGILQHAQGIVPFYKEGYSLDDNVRAILVSQMAFDRFHKEKYQAYLTKYLSFMLLMHREDGMVNNMLSYYNQITEAKLSEDTFGRSLWALGYLVHTARNDSIFRIAHSLYHSSIQNIEHLNHSRGLANTIFGLFHYIRKFPDQIEQIDKLTLLADKLCQHYESHSISRWNWFDAEITYDNGLLPAALYIAYQVTHNDRYLAIANEATAFIEDICFDSDHLSLVGNTTWSNSTKHKSEVGQQPLDATAMVILYDTQYKTLKKNRSIELLKKSFLWFFGENDLNIPLYDSQNKGVYDGMEEFEVNLNQGAESNITYLIAWLIAEPYFRKQG